MTAAVGELDLPSAAPMKEVDAMPIFDRSVAEPSSAIRECGKAAVAIDAIAFKENSLRVSM